MTEVLSGAAFEEQLRVDKLIGRGAVHCANPKSSLDTIKNRES